MDNEQIKFRILGPILIAIAIVSGVVIAANALRHRNDGPKIVSVKGSASQDFLSDLVVWNITIKSTTATPLEGLKDIERQKSALSKFLNGYGVLEEGVDFGPVRYVENVTGYYDKVQERYVEIKNGYTVFQSATITSTRVEDIERAIRSVGELIAQNVTADSQSPRYYYTQLADLKLEMVAAASADARARAEQIASENNAKLGGLRRANLGVFQIVGKHSDEVYSWGGNFNTSEKEKTVSITITSDFLLK